MIVKVLTLVGSLALLSVASLAGCSGATNCSAPVPASCPKAAPTYASEVEPLITKYCNNCHVAGGEESQKPLTSYAQVKALSSDIESQISGCEMPPSGETQPSDAEREVILSWIVCGASND